MNGVWMAARATAGADAPCWLNGVVPLAFLLRNAGVEQLDPVLGIYKVGLRRLGPVAPRRTRHCGWVL